MGIQFHETGYGRRFFDVQLPKLIKGIERLTEAIEKQNKIMEGKEKETTKEEK